MQRSRRSPRRIGGLVTIVAVLALSAATTLATLSLDLSLEQLTALSTFVVHGKVTGVESRWNADETRILTYVELAALETIKGKRFGQIVVEVDGGQIGDRAVYISGTPTFELGEEVLLFLRRGRGHFRVSEMDQGKLRIERDGDGKAWLGGQADLKPLLLGRAVELDAGGKISLDAFLAELRPLVQAQGGGSWNR